MITASARGISRSWLIALFVTANLTVTAPAAAQSRGSTAAVSAWSADAARTPLANRDYPPADRFAGHESHDAFGQRTRSRDSLKNGTFIGAVVGAVSLGALAAILCNAYQEPGEPSCLGDTLRCAAFGGAIGAGAGVAIDAARNQRGITVRFAVRF